MSRRSRSPQARSRDATTRRAGLAAWLERAASHRSERAGALEPLDRAGYVTTAASPSRARRLLAARGYGDAAIRATSSATAWRGGSTRLARRLRAEERAGRRADRDGAAPAEDAHAGLRRRVSRAESIESALGSRRLGMPPERL